MSRAMQVVQRMAVGAGMALWSSAALAGFEPYLGWATVGDPGNRGVTDAEAPRFVGAPPGIGRVDEAFRISRNEITAEEYFPFLDSFRVHFWDPGGSSEMTGSVFSLGGFDENGVREFSLSPLNAKLAVNPIFVVAASYANWLHNDMGDELEDFTTGAYNLQPFFDEPYTAQISFLPEPDARYWIPTFDQAIKALYWDPEKDDGAGGYWRYPHGSDEPPVYGMPGEEGVESSAGSGRTAPVDAFPDVQSPWGLLGGSGTWGEFSSGEIFDLQLVMQHGSMDTTSAAEFFDRVDQPLFRTTPFGGNGSFRIATRVPGIGTGMPLVLVGACCLRRRRSIVLAAALGTALAAPAAAGFEPYLGWATVGDPGNRGVTDAEAPRFIGAPTEIGRVDEAFRISRNEITVAEYFDFIDTYRQVHFAPTMASQFIGTVMVIGGFDDNGIREYSFNPASARVAINPNFFAAAMYCNWLHNGMGTDLEDFTTGAYDIQPWYDNPSDPSLLPILPEPDAKYWIPTTDQTIKALYWDPEKDDGAGGYWRYPHGSDEPPVYGMPGEDGVESSAGSGRVAMVDAFPDVQSPSGLLAGSGTWREFSAGDEFGFESVLQHGSTDTTSIADRFDRLDRASFTSPTGGLGSFRIATRVPAPGSLIVVLVGACVATSRQRRS